MSTQTAADTLALNGGAPAFVEMTGHAQPKIGVAEFMSIAERFGFDDDALERIRTTVADADLGAGPI